MNGCPLCFLIPNECRDLPLKPAKTASQHEISVFSRGFVEVMALLGCYQVYDGNVTDVSVHLVRPINSENLSLTVLNLAPILL